MPVFLTWFLLSLETIRNFLQVMLEQMQLELVDLLVLHFADLAGNPARAPPPLLGHLRWKSQRIKIHRLDYRLSTVF
jgi:hypothetical protein